MAKQAHNFDKLVTGFLAAGLGWVFLGPIGGLVGGVLGYLFNVANSSPQKEIEQGRNTMQNQTRAGDFALSLIVLVAAVMKADGKVKKSELDYVKSFFIQNFGSENTQSILLMLRDILKKDIPVDEVCLQIRSNMDYSTRVQLVHFLYGIAFADKVVDPSELQIITHIANLLNLDPSEIRSLQGMYHQALDASYEILGIEREANPEQIKKAYRQLAITYHPDKVSHLGQDVQQSAHEKFQKINEAYEKIKKERGMN